MAFVYNGNYSNGRFVPTGNQNKASQPVTINGGCVVSSWANANAIMLSDNNGLVFGVSGELLAGCDTFAMAASRAKILYESYLERMRELFPGLTLHDDSLPFAYPTQTSGVAGFCSNATSVMCYYTTGAIRYNETLEQFAEQVVGGYPSRIRDEVGHKARKAAARYIAVVGNSSFNQVFTFATELGAFASGPGAGFTLNVGASSYRFAHGLYKTVFSDGAYPLPFTNVVFTGNTNVTKIASHHIRNDGLEQIWLKAREGNSGTSARVADWDDVALWALRPVEAAAPAFYGWNYSVNASAAARNAVKSRLRTSYNDKLSLYKMWGGLTTRTLRGNQDVYPITKLNSDAGDVGVPSFDANEVLDRAKASAVYRNEGEAIDVSRIPLDEESLKALARQLKGAVQANKTAGHLYPNFSSLTTGYSHPCSPVALAYVMGEAIGDYETFVEDELIALTGSNQYARQLSTALLEGRVSPYEGNEDWFKDPA